MYIESNNKSIGFFRYSDEEIDNWAYNYWYGYHYNNGCIDYHLDSKGMFKKQADFIFEHIKRKTC